MIEATLPENWQSVTISEVAEVIMGQSPPSETYNTDGDGLPFFQGKAEFGDETPIPVKWCTAPTRIAEPNDILLSVRAPVGATNLASETCGIGRGLAALRATPELLEPWYLLYVLRLFEPVLVNRGQGSTFDAINRRDIESVKIPLPTLSEQRRIVDILRQADDLRRLRLETDARMEELKSALFDEMFGNPVVNPKKWKIKHLSKVGKLDRGRSRHRPRNAPHLYGGPYPFIQTGDRASSNGWITEYSQTYSEAGLAQSRLWDKGTLCITIAANIAKTAILSFDACFPDSVVGFIPGSEVRVEYIRQLFEVIQGRLESIAPQAAQKNINLQILNELCIPVPPIELQDEFAMGLVQIRSLRETQEKTSRKLTTLFDAMLACAFTGELTAVWRTQNSDLLQEEVTQRDIALGLRSRKVEVEFITELDTQAGREAFDYRVQETLRPAVEQLVKAVPTIRLGDIVKIEPLVDLSQLVTPVLSTYRSTVETSFLRSIEGLSDVTQELLASSFRSIQTATQEVLDAHQRQIMELAGQLAQIAALITRRPDEDHPCYHSLRALSEEQYWVYLAALRSDGYFIAENLLDKDDLPVEKVRRTLALLETLGLVARVTVPATSSTDAGLFYVPTYRALSPDDDSRNDDLAALETAFSGLVV
jgi:type I restriction enzyme S subunit